MHKFLFALSFLFSFNLFAIDDVFQQYLKDYNNDFTNYRNTIDQQYSKYKNAYDSSLKEYQNQIKKHWPKAKISSNTTWIEYSNSYTQRKSIDYKNKKISLEVLANNNKEAYIKIESLFLSLLDYDLKKAIRHDILANKIAQKLKSFEDEEINNFVLVSDSITKFTQKKYVSLLSNQKLERTEYNGKVLFKASIKLPKAFTINQSKHYKTTIIKNAKQSNMPASLIYAVIHSESYFNPMAKSSAPAFGLMQIVPKSEGVDSYYALYGNKKLLSASYLYNSSNNILIGSTYLNILFYKYLKNIKDEQSRLYCTIAAYHTSSGNVASVFIDTPNINQAIQAINSMNSAQVYKELLRKLPYKETKNYLFLVNKRMASYKKILTTVHREY